MVTGLPDTGTDPAAEVLAACDLREKRIDAATGPRWYRYDARRTPAIRAAAERDGPGRRVAYAVVPQDADHIAAEANPEHARAEVALWRQIAEDYAADNSGAFGSVMDFAVAAARAYLTGAGG